MSAQQRVEQIAMTAVPVGCTDVGTWKAFLPAVVSSDVVIAHADLAWLLAIARDSVTSPGETT